MRLFKSSSVFILIAILFSTLFCAASFAQRRNRGQKRASKPAENVDNALTAEKAAAAFAASQAAADANERIEKLEEFVKNFPDSELTNKAREILIVSHIEVGENDFRENDAANGIEEFRQAAAAFTPDLADSFFNDIVAKLPFNAFFRAKHSDERRAAVEIARVIEPKVRDNSARLLALANFYLVTENAGDAKRLAARALQIEPRSAAAEIVLGMANRIGFDLDAAAKNFERAAELDPASLAARQNLADVRRGLGQTKAAHTLYGELLAANPANELARNGLILALFDLGQKDEAEQELNRALEQNPKNFVLQTSAAYWYAAHGEAAKAAELANRAVAQEPRYVWAHVALARALVLQKQPLEAERALFAAKQFGSFPTLDYELANAHFAAGLFDEARDDLRRSFAYQKGKLATNLAGRQAAEAADFNSLLDAERRAGIFQFERASSAAEAKKLKELLVFSDALTANANESELQTAAEDFAADADEMQAHRQLYAANRLLANRKALPAVAELARAATNNLEKSLDVSVATAAVLADELYAPRRAANARGQIVNVPTLDRETLSKILRGRIEETAGWTLFQANKFDEAAIRLRRAVGILPANSAWWRSSLWKLGTTLEAAGSSREALNVLITSYKADQPNETRLAVIQNIYRRLNNNSLNGLERLLSQTNSAPTAALPPTNANASGAAASPTNVRRSTPNLKNPLPSVVGEIVPKTNESARIIVAGESRAKPAQTVESNNEAATANENAAQNRTENKTANNAAKTETVAPESTANNQPETKAEPTNLAPQAETAAAPSNEPKIDLPIYKEKAAEKPTEKSAENLTEKSAHKTIGKSAENSPETFVENSTQSSPEKKIERNAANAPRVAVVPPAQTDSNSVAASAPERAAKEVSATLVKPRVVVQNINGATANVAETAPETAPATNAAAPCELQISQKQISLIRNGGAATLIVAASSAESARQLSYTVSSPSDLAIVPQESPQTNDDFSRLFQIRSISEITKNFVITFESNCGKQEVQVKVR